MYEKLTNCLNFTWYWFIGPKIFFPIFGGQVPAVSSCLLRLCQKEAQLLLGDRVMRKHAKDCWNGRGNDNLGWNDLQMYFKVIKSGTNRMLVYEFLLVVYSNFCRITHRFWEIWCETVQWQLYHLKAVVWPCMYKKAVLSQRWPRNAPYIWVLWKFSGLPDYAHGHYSQHFHGRLFRSTLWMFLQNLKSVALPVPEIIRGTQKIWAVPGYAHAPFSQKFLMGFYCDRPRKYACQIWSP